MANNALRFVGGSLHGKRLALRDGNPAYRVALRPDYSNVLAFYDRGPASCTPLREETYYRETHQVGRNTRVELMVLMALTEDEKCRRIADLIEGTDG